MMGAARLAAIGMVGWCMLELGLRAATGLLAGGWSAAATGLSAAALLVAARRG